MNPKKTRKTKSKKHKLTFGQHLQELRDRILISFSFFVLGSILGYIIHPKITDFLIKPLNQPVFYTSPAGGFNFTLQISLFFGFLVSTPIFVFHIIRFIEPTLPQKYPKIILTTLIFSTILLLLGISFAYFVSLPAALYFLNKFSTSQIQSLISTDEYFTFVTRYLIGFGLIFQLPLVMLMINIIHKISIKSMLHQEKWLILGSAIFAGILTPTPDILNQLIMAFPIILLYQLSIVLILIANKAP